jgi:hypothetical protein
MSTDPLQQLIDAGAIPSNPFPANSRYDGVPLALYTPNAEEPGIPYVLRRFIPQRREIAIVAEHIVQAAERPDLLAAQVLGDPELYWRLADANVVTDPFELTDTPGVRVVLPLPAGF